jgi:hypothetical protein
MRRGGVHIPRLFRFRNRSRACQGGQPLAFRALAHAAAGDAAQRAALVLIDSSFGCGCVARGAASTSMKQRRSVFHRMRLISLRRRFERERRPYDCIFLAAKIEHVAGLPRRPVARCAGSLWRSAAVSMRRADPSRGMTVSIVTYMSTGRDSALLIQPELRSD